MGRWRAVYVVSLASALYLNVFVLTEQLYQKVPPLNAVATTQSEPAFHADEIAAMVAFVAGPETGFVTGASLTIDGGFMA